jgi:hypothetical protein
MPAEVVPTALRESGTSSCPETLGLASAGNQHIHDVSRIEPLDVFMAPVS